MDKRTISVRMSQDDYSAISEKAKNSQLSINGYLLSSALNKSDANNLDAFRIGQIACKLNLATDMIDDKSIQDKLKEGISEIWQYLK